MSRFYGFFVGLVLIGALTACGQMGPLEPPPESAAVHD